VNGGVQGYTSFQGLRLLKEKGPALRPDIVTLAFINNDVSLDVMPDSRRAPGGAAGAIRDLLFKSRLYMLLRNVSVDLEAEHLAEKTCTVARVSVDEFRDNIRQFVDLSRSMGFRLVLINMPHDRATTTHDDYRRVLRETASAEKIPLVDCFASWKKARRDAMYLDMVHPSTEGQKAIAAEILKVIKDQKVISTP
jgi:lysophospholipase L1-like esterase